MLFRSIDESLFPMLNNEEGFIKNREEPKSMSEFYKHVIKRFDFIKKFVNDDPERSKFNAIISSLQSSIMNHSTNYGINIITRRIVNDAYVIVDSLGKENISIEEADHYELVFREKNKKTSVAFKTMDKETLFTKLSSDNDSKIKTRGLWVDLVISGIILIIFLYIFNAISFSFYNKEIDHLKYLKNTYKIITEVHHVLYLVRETNWDSDSYANQKVNLGFDTYDEYLEYIYKNLLTSGKIIATFFDDNKMGMKNYYQERNVNLSYMVNNYQNEVVLYLTMSD